MARLTDFPTLDPELAAAIASLPDVDLSDVASARASAGRSSSAGYDGIDLDEILAPGENGSPDVSIRLMRPAGAVQTLPVLIAMHGGGFVLGCAQDFDYFCVDAVRELSIAVANVEYRLAPETVFPGPLDDCYAALRHVHSHAAELGLDPNRIAVGGSSAGGALAAGTALRARDEGGPPITFQLLLSPALDDRPHTARTGDGPDAPVLSRRSTEFAWRHYLGPGYTGPGDPAVSPYAAPARAIDLTGLPPAYIAAMEIDPVRDDDLDFALRLLRAGVSVELHSYPGAVHGTAELAPRTACGRRIQRGLLDGLARGLRSAS